METRGGVLLTPLKRISHTQGDVLHGMKKSDIGFVGFGEAYFSSIVYGEKKGWKSHSRMTLNLVVPLGRIRFVVLKAGLSGENTEVLADVELGDHNYQRLTIPPKSWVAFLGLTRSLNMLLNIADLEHDPQEAVNVPIDTFIYEW